MISKWAFNFIKISSKFVLNGKQQVPYNIPTLTKSRI